MTKSNFAIQFRVTNKLLGLSTPALNLIFLGVMIGGSILILGSLYLVYDAQIFGERQSTKTDLMWVSITFTIIHVVLTNTILLFLKKMRHTKFQSHRVEEESIAIANINGKLIDKVLETPSPILNLIFLGVMIGGSILILGSLYLVYDAQIFGERQSTKTDLMWVSITFTIIHVILTNASLFAFKKMRYAKTLIQREKDELAKIDKAKDEFTAMISHELKTPLVPISGYAGLLLADKYGKLNDMQREKIHVIQSSTNSMLKLISDLLDAQKIELGKLRLDKKEENLNEIVLDTIERTKLEINKAGISITTDLQDGLSCVCDKNRIGQVISNALLNSIDFCPKNTGIIRISTRLYGDFVRIVVKDNGIGMTKEKLSKIFVKFYQGDTSITREHGGTGLGLAVCKGLVEGHDGKIWLQSEGVGKGTEVHIVLPEAKTTSKNTLLYSEICQTKNSKSNADKIIPHHDGTKTRQVVFER